MCALLYGTSLFISKKICQLEDTKVVIRIRKSKKDKQLICFILKIKINDVLIKCLFTIKCI